MNDLLDAQVEKQKSDDLVKDSEAKTNTLKDQKAYVEELATSWEKWTNAQNELLLTGDADAYNAADAELIKLRSSYELLGITYLDTTDELSDLDKQIADSEKQTAEYQNQADNTVPVRVRPPA